MPRPPPNKLRFFCTNEQLSRVEKHEKGWSSLAEQRLVFSRVLYCRVTVSFFLHTTGMLYQQRVLKQQQRPSIPTLWPSAAFQRPRRLCSLDQTCSMYRVGCGIAPSHRARRGIFGDHLGGETFIEQAIYFLEFSPGDWETPWSAWFHLGFLTLLGTNRRQLAVYY